MSAARAHHGGRLAWVGLQSSGPGFVTSSVTGADDRRCFRCRRPLIAEQHISTTPVHVFVTCPRQCMRQTRQIVIWAVLDSKLAAIMTADSDLLTVHDRAGTAGAEPAEPAAAAPVPASQHLRGGDDRFGAAADDGDAGTSKDAGDAPTGLADLPPALLHGVVALCWAQAGAPAVLALSRTGRALLRACDGVLAAQRALPQAATAPLRAGPLPGPARAGAVMGRLLKHMRSVAAIDLSGMHFWVYDSSLAVGCLIQRLRLPIACTVRRADAYSHARWPHPPCHTRAPRRSRGARRPLGRPAQCWRRCG